MDNYSKNSEGPVAVTERRTGDDRRQDPTNPAHYKGDDVAKLIEKFGLDFNLGNALKYIARHEAKGGTEDLLKAGWYLNRAVRNRQQVGVAVNAQSMDAQEWAMAFHCQFPLVSADDALGWFANAIMAGYDRAKNEAQAKEHQEDALKYSLGNMMDAVKKQQTQRGEPVIRHPWIVVVDLSEEPEPATGQAGEKTSAPPTDAELAEVYVQLNESNRQLKVANAEIERLKGVNHRFISQYGFMETPTKETHHRLSVSETAQLVQLAKSHPHGVGHGDVISKEACRTLIEMGLASKDSKAYFATEGGLKWLRCAEHPAGFDESRTSPADHMKRTYTLDDVLPGTMFEDETGVHWVQGTGTYVKVSNGMPTREDELFPSAFVVAMLNNARSVRVAEEARDSVIGKLKQDVAMIVGANSKLTEEIASLRTSPCPLAEEVTAILKQAWSGELTHAQSLEAIEQRTNWHVSGATS